MKNIVRLTDEISKNVNTRKFITTKIEYFCNSKEDTETLTENLTRILTKNLGDSNLAKITYEYYPSEKKVEVEIIEHV